jgi:hypothetical protein
MAKIVLHTLATKLLLLLVMLPPSREVRVWSPLPWSSFLSPAVVEVLVERVAHHAGAVVARVRAVVAGVRAVALMTDGVGATASSPSFSSLAVVEPLGDWLILAVLAGVRSRLVTSSSSLSFSSSSLSLSLSFVAFASPSWSSASVGFWLLRIGASRSQVSLLLAVKAFHLCFKSCNFLGQQLYGGLLDDLDVLFVELGREGSYTLGSGLHSL